MKIITLLTDFGANSSYVSQMKGVILSNTNANIVDINHEITPHNIKEGAFVLKNTVQFFPKGTIHVAVIDPGVGTERRGIVIATKEQIFIGPDNGLLIPAAKLFGNFIVYEIKNRLLMRNEISNTFHGRDIFSPVAARVLNGVYFQEIGPIINNYTDIKLEKFKIDGKNAVGKIVYIDRFGNIITNIEGDNLRRYLEFDKKIMVMLGKHQLQIPFVRSYGYGKQGELIATIGSSNLLEISINQGNAQKKLKVKPEDEIKILI